MKEGLLPLQELEFNLQLSVTAKYLLSSQSFTFILIFLKPLLPSIPGSAIV